MLKDSKQSLSSWIGTNFHFTNAWIYKSERMGDDFFNSCRFYEIQWGCQSHYSPHIHQREIFDLLDVINCIRKRAILVLQYIPVHPGLHSKQVPFSMWHVLSLQLFGHGWSQLVPYTPSLTHPVILSINCLDIKTI